MENGECDLSCSSPVILAYERGCNNVDGGGQRPIDPVPRASNENTRSTPQIQFSKSIGGGETAPWLLWLYYLRTKTPTALKQREKERVVVVERCIGSA